MSHNTPEMIPLEHLAYSDAESATRAQAFFELLNQRRSVRQFSDRAVPKSVITDCLRTAGTAPSGANLQPWRFVAVSDPDLKSEIRKRAEKEESEFYDHRAPPAWLEALRPFGTDDKKPYLETAPYLIAIFAQTRGQSEAGEDYKTYYPTESVGLATGMLIAAIHNAGLVCLTHTPSPMGFLNEILDRPKTERAFLLLIVGHPEDGTMVPNIGRKDLDEFVTFR